MTKEELRRALETLLIDIDQGILRVKREYPNDPFRAQYPNGQFILLNAMASKATALAALASLEAS